MYVSMPNWNAEGTSFALQLENIIFSSQINRPQRRKSNAYQVTRLASLFGGGQSFKMPPLMNPVSRLSQRDGPISKNGSSWLRGRQSPRNSVIFTSSTDSVPESSSSVRQPPTAPRRLNSTMRATADIIIAIMGRTGCGKSSFASRLVGEDCVNAIGHNVRSVQEAHLFQEIECIVKERKILVIDTPDFDDTANEDVVLERMSKWLQDPYGGNKSLTGIIYMHDIDGPPIECPSMKFIMLLRTITGQNDMNNVVLLTTKWGESNSSQQKAVEQESRLLQGNSFWNLMKEYGATVMRDHGTKASAESIVLGLLQKARATKAALCRPVIDSTYVSEERMGPLRQAESSSSLRDELKVIMCRKIRLAESRLRKHCDKRIDKVERTQKRNRMRVVTQRRGTAAKVESDETEWEEFEQNLNHHQELSVIVVALIVLIGMILTLFWELSLLCTQLVNYLPRYLAIYYKAA
ncbi:uncharacterized protein F4822DRAFT_338343 [Hypoxylon trugodes]|uniref:uncharacterized protein n=1 Tax=Hypoxylon trugodes TaxID=326681 RepID=UPI002197CD79|nr:uncharacterized protein F4822DRAFT_338343 [Hypoxylon trugodes]KAI1385242.1 hypothetical protein F4822DRAFT_338343 [Hypoxylon trugodes]